jgi:hypothetical protein
MSRRFSQYVAAALLAVYGAMAVLGHGGMHAVQDACGVAHGHGSHPSACGHHHHDPGNGHGHCCHHHSHQHAGEESHDHDNDSHRHGPHHDPNDCVVCHYFATAAVQQSAAPEIAGEQLANHSTLLQSTVWQKTGRFVQPIRGPPAPLC